MVARAVVVIGAGGFGRETLDVLAAINASTVEPQYELLGVLDEDPSELNRERLAVRGIAILGAPSEWIARGQDADFVVAVGDPALRRGIANEFRNAGYTAATLVHPLAVVGSEARIGPGVVICSGAQLSSNVTLGAHVHVNPNATIGHDSILADCTSVNPGAIVSGEVVIEEEVLIGAGAVVLQGLRIGRGSTVGASACVTRDVERGVRVVGIPARRLP